MNRCHFLHAAFLLTIVGCTGDNGITGANSVLSTSIEPPGTNCADGGIKIEVGPDTDGDGLLDPSEVTGTSYVCNGDGGTQSLVQTTAEGAGANCPFGGTKIESGLDTNHNGTLDPDEIDPAATSYVCTFGPSGTINPSTGLVLAVKPGGVSTSASDPVTVRFTLKDDRGFPLDLAGTYSTNLEIAPRFSLSYFTKDAATNNVSPLVVYTKSGGSQSPTMYNPRGSSAGHGTLVENGLGAGDYTYTFPTTSTSGGTAGVAYDPTKLGETHVVWIQASRQTDLIFQINANTYYAANTPHYFVPNALAAPITREIVSQAKCDNCHAKFKAETTASAVFHGGGRVNASMCNVCHNPGRSNTLANSSSFVHRIHNGPMVATANLFHGISATYPRDVRECAACHGGAAQGAQALSNPSTLACKGCHDYVSFTASALATCQNPLVRAPDGKPVPCNHFAGVRTDAECASCHGPTGGFPTANYHKPILPPDPNNAWNPGGTNNNTNAAFVASNGVVPTGADVITYDLKTVATVLDTSVVPNVNRPQLTFKLKRNGTDVVFQTYAPPTITELMPNFVGSPSAYFAFAVPQDGNLTPADFNATASGYIKRIWDGTATGSGAGTMTGPDATGYYTITLTGVQVPSTARMLTGGVGYSYSLSSTPPLVQTNVQGYLWTPNVPADGKAQGGLSVPPPNVWKVATGHTSRRPIVDNAKCNACHGALGATPAFHGGQRNDGPTCSFCHNPNRTSAGWAASSKYFIHAIHGGRKRTVPFTWHASAVGEGYNEIEFPGTLNTCTTCHLPGTYDFSNTANLNALGSEQLSYAAAGTLDPDPMTNSTYYTVSPYVMAGAYGLNFSYSAATNTTREAADTNLVHSPLTAACAACHDSTIALDHMRANGGMFYTARATALAPGAPQEQCMICHGPGRIAAIGEVHQR